MSLRKVEEAKGDRGFRKWDLPVYGILVLLIAVMFIAVFATRDRSPLSGVRVYIDNVAVFEYNFQTGEYEILADGGVEIAEEDDERLLARFSYGGGYNLVEVNRSGWVTVTDADCGTRDCVYMPAIQDNSGIIYCSPHRLKIVPYDFDPDDGNITLG